MNSSAHKIIIKSILDVSNDRFPVTNFKKSLELIISDFQDQITIDRGLHTGASPSRVGRRPESLVLDSWRIWKRRRSVRSGCWWVRCSFQLTVDFIEKIFSIPPSCFINITWGTLLRYLVFINENSERWIPSTIERECRWGDHLWNVSNMFIELVMDVGHPVSSSRDSVPYYWTKIFNDEEAEYMETISSASAHEQGYLMPEDLEEPEPVPVPEPVPEEPTPTQQSNDSVRMLQDMIDTIARGEKPDMNEGEYLRLSQSLKGFFKSSE